MEDTTKALEIMDDPTGERLAEDLAKMAWKSIRSEYDSKSVSSDPTMEAQSETDSTPGASASSALDQKSDLLQKIKDLHSTQKEL